jgi:hypothetical protein
VAGLPVTPKPDLVEFSRAVAGAQRAVDPAFVPEFQESTATHPVPAEFMEAVP